MNVNGEKAVLTSYFNKINTFPRNNTDEVPEGLPENVKSLYEEALEVGKSGEKTARVTSSAYRTVLEAALRDLLKEKGKNAKGEWQKLNNLIDIAAKEGLITKTIQEWAHTIKTITNEASHPPEKPIPLGEAKAMGSITTFILMEIYVLPEAVDKARQNYEARIQPALPST